MIQHNSKFLNCIIFNGKKYIPANISPKNTSLRILLNDDNLTFGIHSMSVRKNNTVVVDWGDGTQDTYNNVPLIHTYSQSGEYLVSISDGVSNINVTNGNSEYNPSALVEICSFGTHLTNLQNNAFRNTVNLGYIDFSNSNISALAGAVFQGSGVSSVTINDTMRQIGGRSFSACRNLTEFSIPENNLSILGEMQFHYDYDLSSYDFPVDVQQNRIYCFRYTSAITQQSIDNPYKKTISIPSSWTLIPEGCFSGIPFLDTCIIPQECTKINRFAFGEGNDSINYDDNRFSPLFNGLQKLVFEDRAVDDLSNLISTTLKETLPFASYLSSSITDDKAVSIERMCGNDKVKELVKSIIKPYIILVFKGNDGATTYKYLKENQSLDSYVGAELSALLKYTDSAPVANYPCEYVVVKDIDVMNEISSMWGDDEQLQLSGANIVYSDANSNFTTQTPTTSSLIFENLPTIATFMSGDNVEYTKSIYNGKVFLSDDLSGLQDQLVDIQFGKYSTLSIGENALCGCVNLRHAYIPATTTYIGKFAFRFDSSLTAVDFKRSRSVEIDERAFIGCTSLNEFSSEYETTNYLGDEYVQIAENSTLSTFSGTKLSTNICFVDSTSISRSFIADNNIKNVLFPKATSFSVRNDVFSNTKNLQLLYVPELTSLNVGTPFHYRSNADVQLSLDFRGRTNNNIPPIPGYGSYGFFQTSGSSSLSNFVAIVPLEMYGDWCVHEDWIKYHGSFSCRPSTVSIENPTAKLFNEYCLADEYEFKILKDSTGKWTLDGEVFDETTYGKITYDGDELTSAIVHYTRGQVVPDIAT